MPNNRIAFILFHKLQSASIELLRGLVLRLLIAEAEKAAKALEVAAKTSPLAHASLMESRMLIAEAHKLIESIEIEDATAFIEDDNESDLSEAVPLLENEHSLDLKSPKKVNGVHSIPSDLEENDSFSFDEFIFADFINGNGSTPYPLEIEEIEPNGFASSMLDTMMNGSGSPKNRVDHKPPTPNGVSVRRQNPALNMPELRSEKVEEAAKKEAKVIRKWVRGRLVEVDEEEEEQAAA